MIYSQSEMNHINQVAQLLWDSNANKSTVAPVRAIITATDI